MLAARTASSSVQQQKPSSRAPDAHLLLQSLSASSSPTGMQPSASPAKEKRRVPSGGRGGLGNIRAKRQPTDKSKDTSPKSPPKLASTTSPPNSRFRQAFSRSGSTSTRSTTSGEASVKSVMESAVVSVASGTASVISGSTEEEREDYFSERGSLSIGSPRPDDVSEPCSPVSSSYVSPFSSPPASGTIQRQGSGKGETTTAGTGTTRTDYVLHLHADARQRALEKRLARARAKEARLLSGTRTSMDGLDGQGILEAEEADEGVENKVVKLRSGRGGAGFYKKVGGGVDPALHPRAANITREYEARAAAQEQNLVAASRVRVALEGSTGRGGSGNVGAGGKAVSKRRRKDKKRSEADEGREGQGIAQSNVGPVVECSSEELSGHDKQQEDDDAIIAIDVVSQKADQKKNPGLRKLWRRVMHPNHDSNAVVDSSCPFPQDDSTPRPSLGYDVLEIRRPASPSLCSFPTSTSAPPAPSSPRSPGSTMKLRKRVHSREEIKEGARLLAFVNAALPDLPGARNVLGVPGTPGFPLPGGKSVSGASTSAKVKRSQPPSSGDVTPTWPITSTSSNSTTSNPPGMTRAEGVMVEEEEWVDDDTLQDVNEESDEFEEEEEAEEEDDDSDIDPLVLPSAFRPRHHHQLHYTDSDKQYNEHIQRHQQTYALPRSYRGFEHGKRPDSLDVVIRVALDKLDRTERLEEAEGEDENVIDAYAFPAGIDPKEWTGHSSDTHARDAPPPHLRLSPARNGRTTTGALPPAPLILPATPKCSRASASVLRARFGSETGTNLGKTGVAGPIPAAGPPPSKPVPCLPEEH